MSSTAPLGAGVPAASAAGSGARHVVGPEGRPTAAPEVRRRRPAPDRFMRRLLRVPDRRPALSEDSTHRIFSVSILISALRCLLTYIFLPILTPLLGAATSVGPDIGIPLSVVALYFDVVGIRRFWLADHRWRWAMTGVYAAVMTLVVALLAINISAVV